MPLWEWLGGSPRGLLFLLLLYGLSLVVRRRWISRNGGTFEFSVRVRPGRAGRGWILGVGRYTGDDLEGFRVLSLAPWPRLSYRRAELEYVGRRDAPVRDAPSLSPGHIIVSCRTPAGPLEVAMSPEALTGFLAWLEGAPPGRPAQRWPSPPGRHSTSPFSRFACRARMNSRSENRLRYYRARTFTES